MNDKKLLELAAKAVSKNIAWESSRMFGFWAHDLETGCEWNPLKNNGDALQLSIDLDLTVIQETKDKVCAVHWTDVAGVHVAWKNDKHAATRRAIVRAAAEIGARR